MIIFKCVCVCLPVWLSDFPETDIHMNFLSHINLACEAEKGH